VYQNQGGTAQSTMVAYTKTEKMKIIQMSSMLSKVQSDQYLSHKRHMLKKNEITIYNIYLAS